MTKRSSHGRHRNGVKRRKPRSGHRQTCAPSRKTLAATIASAIAIVALYFTNKNGTHAITATFAAGWLVPPGARKASVATERRRRTAVT